MIRKKKDLSEPNTDSIKSIKEDVKYLTKKENLLNNGKGFVLWILMNYFNLNSETASSCLIDGPNDKGIDAFIEEDETIKIVQCKFFDDTNKKVGSKKVGLFKGCLDWLKEPEEVKKLNVPKFHEAALTFCERWNEEVEVHLHFFAFGKFSSEANQERIVFNNSELKERVQMYFHDIEDIVAVYNSKLQVENPLVDEEVKIELIHGEYFVKTESMPSIVATIRGKDILAMYKKYGDTLFERNIRFYKGARKGSINAKIIDTVLDNDERRKFWYYNNGISFVCRDFSLNETVTPPILTVQGFQIINGCQTTVCLSDAIQRYENGGGILDEVQMVVRFIKAPVKEVDLITLYTNSQNPVSEIQLKSNDPLQKRIKEELAKYTPPYFYSIKEGDWQKLSQKCKKKFNKGVMEMSEVAQAIYSFTTDPAFARRWKNKLFSEKYYEIFKKDISVEELILPWEILKVVNDEISKYRREFNKLKKSPNSFTEQEGKEILKKEFLLYSNLIILHFIGKLIKKRYRQYSSEIAKKLLNKKLEGRITKIFNYIVGILKFSEKLEQETNLSRFLKNFENITTLYNEIEKAVEMERARTRKDPLEDMLPKINISE
ncbi:MAG TPA: AIPR family protein [bacterium]|nr:AIPR family protein [bacterium]HOL35198.1 AIPR family protein [bacterium]HPP08595.1 AIPR family protein [bacterium]